MLKLVRAQGQGIVSDTGRWGFQHEGVPVGGVLDSFSYALGNLALGNPQGAACLELMGQFDFVCAKPCRVFLANRGANALVNNKRVWCGVAIDLQEGDLLRTQPPSIGFWNLLCLGGGVNVPLVMGSRSTCIPAGFGGLQGRALLVGDEIHAGRVKAEPPKFQTNKCEKRLAMPVANTDSTGCMPIHCLAGPEFQGLTAQSRELFLSQIHVLDLQSSRMGYRLEGMQGKLEFKQSVSLRSHPVHPGMVQLPPSGNPVVLLCEAQVTGGYPRIASVLSCELWKFAQLGLGQGVHWVVVDADSALLLLAGHNRQMEAYHHVIERNSSQSDVD